MIKKIIVLVLAFSVVCKASSYVQKYSFSELKSDLTAMMLYASASDDNGEIFSLFYGNGKNGYASGITKVNSDGEASVLVTPAQFFFGANSLKIVSIYNFSQYGDNVYFVDTMTEQAYAANKNTGDLSVIASGAQLSDLLNYPDNYSFGTVGDACSNGFYFFEEQSQNLLLVNNNGLQIGVSSDQLYDLMGNSSLSAGMTSDNDNNLYWQSMGNIYRWDIQAAAGELVLSQDTILSITGNDSISARDMFFAPDGNIYFYDYTSGILCFDPESASDSLDMILSVQELKDGPAGSSNIYGLSWCDDNIAFTQLTKGYFAVPEPGVISLLTLGGAALLRRAKKQA